MRADDEARAAFPLNDRRGTGRSSSWRRAKGMLPDSTPETHQVPDEGGRGEMAQAPPHVTGASPDGQRFDVDLVVELAGQATGRQKNRGSRQDRSPLLFELLIGNIGLGPVSTLNHNTTTSVLLSTPSTVHRKHTSELTSPSIHCSCTPLTQGHLLSTVYFQLATDSRQLQEHLAPPALPLAIPPANDQIRLVKVTASLQRSRHFQ